MRNFPQGYCFWLMHAMEIKSSPPTASPLSPYLLPPASCCMQIASRQHENPQAEDEEVEVEEEQKFPISRLPGPCWGSINSCGIWQKPQYPFAIKRRLGHVFSSIYVHISISRFYAFYAEFAKAKDKPHCYKWALVSGFRCR